MLDRYNLTCPIPLHDYPHVLLAHGGGGKLMQQLINHMFLASFGMEDRANHDSAVLELSRDRIAFTTDSYVVQPLIFPGGTIGTLAVNGTVNDLAMVGAVPQYLSAGFILEEGLPMTTLWEIVQSMAIAADQAKVRIVTGDTKVVDRGKGDGIFINTAGVGVIYHDQIINPTAIAPGDQVIINGDLGRHGMAIMAMREGLEFDTTLESDCAPLADLVSQLIAAELPLHCLRDLTRGGLASTLNELATARNLTIKIKHDAIPVTEPVQGLCEVLGLDPLYVANEGRFVAIVPAHASEQVLQIMHNHPQGQGAGIIGEVTTKEEGLVTITSAIGAQRILDLLSGQQLPRIC